MAKRRMFSIQLMESDDFYELSALTQALYFHLCLKADDDGVVDSVKSVMRDLKASSKNYNKLLDDGYIIELGKNLIVITHWLSHNQIKRDRYTPTMYVESMKLLGRDDNDRYFKASEVVRGDKCAPQDSIGKNSIDKDSLVKGSTDEGSIAEHSEEKKRENNLSLFLTNNQSFNQTKSASQNNNTDKQNNLSLTMQAGKNAIAIYFMKNYQTTDISGFLDWCEKVNWIGKDGEPILDNYKKYVDAWMMKPNYKK